MVPKPNQNPKGEKINRCIFGSVSLVHYYCTRELGTLSSLLIILIRGEKEMPDLTFYKMNNIFDNLESFI